MRYCDIRARTRLLLYSLPSGICAKCACLERKTHTHKHLTRSPPPSFSSRAHHYRQVSALKIYLLLFRGVRPLTPPRCRSKTISTPTPTRQQHKTCIIANGTTVRAPSITYLRDQTTTRRQRHILRGYPYRFFGGTY